MNYEARKQCNVSQEQEKVPDTASFGAYIGSETRRSEQGLTGRCEYWRYKKLLVIVHLARIDVSSWSSKFRTKY